MLENKGISLCPNMPKSDHNQFKRRGALRWLPISNGHPSIQITSWFEIPMPISEANLICFVLWQRRNRCLTVSSSFSQRGHLDSGSAERVSKIGLYSEPIAVYKIFIEVQSPPPPTKLKEAGFGGWLLERIQIRSNVSLWLSPLLAPPCQLVLDSLFPSEK